MTTRIQHALEVGYIERRPGKGVDPDFDAYWKRCSSFRRPFVRVEHRRGRYHVEADLFPTPRYFTEDLQQRAIALLQSATVNPKKARFHCGPLIVSSDSVAPERAFRIAAELFQLASAAPVQAAFASNSQ
jgi:hypothetical protein